MARIPTLERRIGVPDSPMAAVRETPATRAAMEATQAIEAFATKRVEAQLQSDLSTAKAELGQELTNLQLESLRDNEWRGFADRWNARASEAAAKKLSSLNNPRLQELFGPDATRMVEAKVYNNGVRGWKLESSAGVAQLNDNIQALITSAANSESDEERQGYLDDISSSIDSSIYISEEQKGKALDGAKSQILLGEIYTDIRADALEAKRSLDEGKYDLSLLPMRTQDALRSKIERAANDVISSQVGVVRSRIEVEADQLLSALKDDDIHVSADDGVSTVERLADQYVDLYGMPGGPTPSQVTSFLNKTNEIHRELGKSFSLDSKVQRALRGEIPLTDADQDVADRAWTLPGVSAGPAEFTQDGEIVKTPSFAQRWSAATDVPTRAALLNDFVSNVGLYPKAVVGQVEAMFRTGDPEQMAAATSVLYPVLVGHPTRPLPKNLDAGFINGIYEMAWQLKYQVDPQEAAASILSARQNLRNPEDKKAIIGAFNSEFDLNQASARLKKQLQDNVSSSLFSTAPILPTGALDDLERLSRFVYTTQNTRNMGAAIESAIGMMTRDPNGWGVNNLNPGIRIYQHNAPQKFYSEWTTEELQDQLVFDLASSELLPGVFDLDSDGNPYLIDGELNPEANRNDLLSQVLLVPDGATAREERPGFTVALVQRDPEDNTFASVPIHVPGKAWLRFTPPAEKRGSAGGRESIKKAEEDRAFYQRWDKIRRKLNSIGPVEIRSEDRIWPPLDWDPFHALFDEDIAHGGPREPKSKAEIYERFQSRRRGEGR